MTQVVFPPAARLAQHSPRPRRHLARIVDMFGRWLRWETCSAPATGSSALLGIGGMGQVFAARDELLDRRVAVKLPSTPSKGASERFRREARAAASLNHPNVVSVYDWGEDANGPFLVMELVDGQSLRDVLHTRRTLPPREVADHRRAGRRRTRTRTRARRGAPRREAEQPARHPVRRHQGHRLRHLEVVEPRRRSPIPASVVGTPGLPRARAGGWARGRRPHRRLLARRRPRRAAHRHARRSDRPRARPSSNASSHARRADDPAARYQRAGDLRDVLHAVMRMLDAPVTAQPGRHAHRDLHRHVAGHRNRTTITTATSAPTAGPTSTRWAPVAAPVVAAVAAAAAVAPAVAPLKVKPKKVPRKPGRRRLANPGPRR